MWTDVEFPPIEGPYQDIVCFESELVSRHLKSNTQYLDHQLRLNIYRSLSTG